MAAGLFSALLAVLLLAAAYCAMRRVMMRELGLVRRDEAGVFRIELRRRTGMQSHADGSGGESFPQPVETRSLTWLLCEMPVWSRAESIGLPATCEGRVEQVRAEEFDAHFTPAFRIRAASAKPHRAATA